MLVFSPAAWQVDDEDLIGCSSGFHTSALSGRPPCSPGALWAGEPPLEDIPALCVLLSLAEHLQPWGGSRSKTRSQTGLSSFISRHEHSDTSWGNFIICKIIIAFSHVYWLVIGNNTLHKG